MRSHNCSYVLTECASLAASTVVTACACALEEALVGNATVIALALDLTMASSAVAAWDFLHIANLLRNISLDILRTCVIGLIVWKLDFALAWLLCK